MQEAQQIAADAARRGGERTSGAACDPEDFENLVSDIARLPSPLQLGLYRMWQEPAETTSDTPPDLTPPAAP
jgi:hypothetical protein